MRTRFRSLAFALFAFVGVLNASAFAEVRADFDRDGILDTATIIAAPSPQIHITLSKSGAIFLLLADHPYAIVASDFDHDGLTDLAGITRHRGLVVWKNHGARGFATWHHAIQTLPLAHVSLTPQRHADDHDPIPGDQTFASVPPNDDGQQAVLCLEQGCRVAPPAPAARVANTHSLLPDSASCRSTGSRAPPFTSR